MFSRCILDVYQRYCREYLLTRYSKGLTLRTKMGSLDIIQSVDGIN